MLISYETCWCVIKWKTIKTTDLMCFVAHNIISDLNPIKLRVNNAIVIWCDQNETAFKPGFLQKWLKNNLPIYVK